MQSLVAALKTDAPDLVTTLAEPARLQHGYQVLPQILSSRGSPERVGRPIAIAYSWPWTEKLIESAATEILQSEADLYQGWGLGPNARRQLLEKLANRYSEMRERQQNIDAHVQYNRLWQSAIAADRAGYDRDTILYNAVREREAIHAVLNWPYKNAGAAAIDFQRSGAPLGNFTNNFYQRELLLAREIRAATSKIDAPKYLRIENRNPGLWIVHVPLYTDIDDHEFVQRFTAEVERVWHLYSGGNEFRVELSVFFIPTRNLYNNRGKTHSPSPGDEIDLERHLAMFPGNGAILTTGAIATHVRGRAIVLGPHALSGGVLAHEFGHTLGFRDSYFRGYQDLGQDGFQIMEIDADTDDIMGRADSGAALAKHFAALISSRPAPGTKLF